MPIICKINTFLFNIKKMRVCHNKKTSIIILCHPERSEGSVNTKLCPQILRDAQNDTLIGIFYFNTPSNKYIQIKC